MGKGSRERHYMLGLKEFSDQVQRQPQGAVMVAVPNSPYCPQAGKSRIEVGVNETGPLPENSSVSSGSFVDAGALVVVDSTDPLCPVKRVSPSFRAKVGQLRRGRPFVGYVAKPVEFHWLSLSLGSEQPPPDCQLAFRMPQGKVRARCKVLRSPSGTGEEDGQQLRSGLVTLLFYGMRLEDDAEGQAAAMTKRGTGPRSSTSSLEKQGEAHRVTL